MTNCEKYKDKIKEMFAKQDEVFLAVVEGEPRMCEEVDCNDCQFSQRCWGLDECQRAFVKWLLKEE